MGQVKSVTATVPVEVWSILREGHQRNRERYSRFSDYLSALVCKSADLVALS
jgi:transcriptional regulator of met regulon